MPKKKFKLPERGGFFITNEMILSQAYQDLTKASFNLLWCFLNECRWRKNKRQREWTKIEVSFTEIQFVQLFDTSKQTYLNARNQLIRNGWIQLTYKGGQFRGDMNRYKILCLQNTHVDERWKRYPDENWEHEIPHNKNQLIGVEKRFKKNKKIDSTLEDWTPLGKALPNVLDPLSKKGYN